MKLRPRLVLAGHRFPIYRPPFHSESRVFESKTEPRRLVLLGNNTEGVGAAPPPPPSTIIAVQVRARAEHSLILGDIIIKWFERNGRRHVNRQHRDSGAHHAALFKQSATRWRTSRERFAPVKVAFLPSSPSHLGSRTWNIYCRSTADWRTKGARIYGHVLDTYFLQLWNITLLFIGMGSIGLTGWIVILFDFSRAMDSMDYTESNAIVSLCYSYKIEWVVKKNCCWNWKIMKSR